MNRLTKKTLIVLCAVLAVIAVVLPVLLFALSPGARSPRIVVVGKTSTLEVEFWISLRTGLAEAAADAGMAEPEFRSMEDESDVAGQKALLDEVIEERPDAVIWVAADYEMGDYAAKLAASGIKFVTMDSDVDYDGSFKKSFVGTDNYRAALLEGERAGDGSYGSKAAILVHDAGVKTGRDRVKGFSDGFLGRPGNEIAEVLDCRNSTETARAQTEKLLEEHPDTEIILATNEVVALGVAPVVTERGLKDRIRIFAFDCSKKQIQYLENGTFETILAQYPFRMGYLSYMTALKAARGEEVEAFVDSGMVLIDAENLYKKENQEILFPFK